MTADDVRRALVRISHEIVEKHGGTESLALIGIERRGVPLAERLADAIAAHEDVRPPVGRLDITFYRDDLSQVDRQPVFTAWNSHFHSNRAPSSSSTTSCTPAGQCARRSTR